MADSTQTVRLLNDSLRVVVGSVPPVTKTAWESPITQTLIGALAAIIAGMLSVRK